MIILTFLASLIAEGLVVIGLKKLLFKRPKRNKPEEIPILHSLGLKLSEKPTKTQKIFSDKLISMSRKMVNTTTFEHLVETFVAKKVTLEYIRKSKPGLLFLYRS